ncbi:hypothetical protein MKW98_019761 [Papaver atlanticum]|uniref:SKP1 component dimerisation domain-containing protein n=1 Tax=Papaver atlanticum TaxID=357466 RepID=A0AAD4XWQ2_9MAGN|nr:hypothetical protein MKW98_019761 [Papaver atlanticum]
MKSYIWLQTCDGSIQQVEAEVAMGIPFICKEVFQNSLGSTKKCAISLPERVNNMDTLSLILDYCRFHQVPGRSDKEHKSFDEKFIRIDTDKLCDLASAAYSLELKSLIDITCGALARVIEDKTPEEVREIFQVPDDLTEEEKLEPVRINVDDPRIRLLNQLYARKRKELTEREKQKTADVDEERVDAECSVDDLLLFINEDSKAVKAPNHKKRNRRKKNQPKHFCINNEKDKKELLCDDDIDDELDPAMKEELDKEVEEFARRLNLDWTERKQEILSLGEEGKLTPVQTSDSGMT